MNSAVAAVGEAGADAATLLARVRELPLRLLDRSQRCNARLRERPSEIGELRRHLERECDRELLWRDPEVYFPLYSLGDSAPDLARVDELLGRLRIVLGMESVESPTLPDGFYRLAHRTGELVVRARGELRRFPGGWALPGDGDLRVYLPIPELFRDLLDDEVYPRDGPPPDLDRAASTHRCAMALIGAYDRPLLDAIARTLTTIVLLPPVAEHPDPRDPTLRWSFNLRLRYFGAVFVNPYLVDAFGLAEGVIHEYVHQLFWLWWELDPPGGLPADDAMVRSPLTGALRPATVIVQALFIYANALHFYERALACDLATTPASRWAAFRAEQLRAALPELARRLLGTVVEESSPLGRAMCSTLARVGMERRRVTTPAIRSSVSASAPGATGRDRSVRA